jgi:hypothetical protein
MKPIFYFCCQPENCIDFHEAEWCLVWTEEPPQLETVVSMGGEARWRVVKIATYRPETPQDVDSIHAAYVHPLGLPVPPESEWDCDLLSDPPQSICAEVALIGQTELGIGWGEGIDVPKIGEQIESILELTEEDLIPVEVPKFWTRCRVVPYLPLEKTRIATLEEASFARIFLCWCEPTETTS